MAGDLSFDTKADAVLNELKTVSNGISGIHLRLDTLNGSVKDHEKRLNEQDKDMTQDRQILGNLLTDLNDRKAEARKKKEMLWERVLWLAGAIALAIIVKNFKL